MTGFHWDFEVFLFLAVVVTSVAWIGVRLSQNRQTKRHQRLLAVASYFPLLLVILSVRSFAFEPFRIPSTSMMPNLVTGDFILVDKSAYGIKMPVFHNTLIETGAPQQGDVFVFRSVEDPSIDVIKRVMAVPGDHVRYDALSKQLYINDELVNESSLGPYLGLDHNIDPSGLQERQADINGKTHRVLYSNQIHYDYPVKELVVPEGHYFGMGDNRDFSKDSRVFGLIPENNVVGQAKLVWMHWRPGDFLVGLERVGLTL